MVVSDIEDVFVPLVDGFLVSPQEARSVVDRYLLLLITAKILNHGHGFPAILIRVKKVQYLSSDLFACMYLNTFFCSMHLSKLIVSFLLFNVFSVRVTV